MQKHGEVMNDSREQIINVAANLFMQKGYRQVTMQDIVKATGLSKGAFYHYFESKEVVLKEVVKYFFDNNPFYAEDSLVHGITLKDYCETVIRRISERLERYEKDISCEDNVLRANQYVLIFDALRILPDFQNHFQSLQQREFKAWKSVINNAIDRQEIFTSLDADIVAKQFIYLSYGVGILNVMRDQTARLILELKEQFFALYGTLSKK
ncbi:TetR/AcrR family transcriptional regulator [Mucilaginibacter sp. PAMB04274]|uniref:TetR/AcrR family transcriptional regulator n=1 Tax=Mucilaginibacter sp. PAMB04274 TaxID=3138568 RepID=UPI0031F62F90